MSRLAFNSAVLFGVNLVSAGLNFLLSIIIGRGLGRAGLGQYTFVMSWAFAFGLFAEFGLNTLITRDVAQRRSNAGRYLLGSIIAKSALALPLMIGVWAAAPQLAANPATAVALQAAAPLILLSSLYGSFTALFRAFERMTPIFIIAASGLAVQCIGAALIVASGGGVIGLALLAVGVQLGQIGIAWLIYRHRFRAPASVEADFIRQLLRRALPFAIAGGLGAIELRATTILLAYVAGEAAVGQLTVAVKLTETVRLLPNAFFGAIFPSLATLERVESKFRASAGGLLVFGLAGAISLSLLAGPVIAFTYGSQFAGAVPALRWLAWALAFSLPNTALELYLYARGEEGFVNWVTALQLAILLIAGLLLMIRWGATGAAAATCLAEASMIVPLYWKRLQLVGRNVSLR